MLNTFAHRPRDATRLPFVVRLFRTPGIGEVMVQGLHLFVRGFLFQAGVVEKDRLTATVKSAYLTPNPTWASRTPILAFPRQIPVTPDGTIADFAGEIEGGLRRHFRDRPVAIAWPMRDPAFTPEMLDSLWLDTFPNAEVTRIEGASHYIQEDAHEIVVPLLLDFLTR